MFIMGRGCRDSWTSSPTTSRNAASWSPAPEWPRKGGSVDERARELRRSGASGWKEMIDFYEEKIRVDELPTP